MRSLLTVCLGLGLCLSTIAGCGGEPEETGAGAGEECAQGGDCKSGLFCFVAVKDQPGECRDAPSDCKADELSCSDACFDEIKGECTMGGSACASFGTSDLTISCLGGGT